ncbi:MAG: tetratricopeptide repeat protein [Nannocystaceae bacterium]
MVRQAQKEAERGRVREAERLFHQALDADPRSAEAMIGLSDLAFERSAYASALKYARAASKIAPKSGAYRLRLGDAYFKTMRYTQAREHYEAAAALGEPLARSRLAKLDEQVGR